MSRETVVHYDPQADAHAPRPPVRVDRFLAALHPKVSRAAFARLLARGGVTVGGRRARKGDLLRGGEEVRFAAPAARGRERIPPDANSSLLVRFEDAQLVCVEKPAGMPCVPLSTRERGTVANALVARYPELASVGGPLEAGLLHRLDTATSGLLLAARTAVAHAALRAAWKSGHVEKTYLAIVEGSVAAPGRIDAPLAHHPKSARRMVVANARAASRALQARTDFAPLRAPDAGPYGARTLLSVRLHEGRRHQIRVHLASIGHPVVGDALYGSAGGADARRARGGLAGAGAAGERLALHAHRLRFPHPETGDEVVIESPLPDDMATLLG
jgi:23S rRNA pseudouridine1911/1915/1917 synthase